MKTQPEAGTSRTRTTPLLASTLRRQIDSPSPRPDLFVAALRKGQKHFLRNARRKATAVIFDINQDTIPGREDIQCHLAVVRRELERVLQQVSHRREEHVSVGIHREALVDIADAKTASLRTRLAVTRDCHFGNEVGQRDPLLSRGPFPLLLARRRATDRLEVTQSDPSYGPVRHPSRPLTRNCPNFDGANGEGGSLNKVSQLVCEET